MRDEELNRWAEIYRANHPLRAAGVSFEVFLRWTDRMLETLRLGPAGSALPVELETGLDEHLPLLPRQQRVQREVDFQMTLAELREEAERQEAALARKSRVLGRKRRRAADVRLAGGRLLQPMHPMAVVSARATGGHR